MEAAPEADAYCLAIKRPLQYIPAGRSISSYFERVATSASSERSEQL